MQTLVLRPRESDEHTVLLASEITLSVTKPITARYAPVDVAMLENPLFGRRKFLKLASAAGFVGVASSTSAAAAENEQQEYPITVHGIDGSWKYVIKKAGALEKKAAADDSDVMHISISGDYISGKIHGEYYDNYTSAAYISRLVIQNGQDEQLVIDNEIDFSYDTSIEAREGEWTYYLSGRRPITNENKAEDSDANYGSSVSGYVSASGAQTMDT